MNPPRPPGRPRPDRPEEPRGSRPGKPPRPAGRPPRPGGEQVRTRHPGKIVASFGTEQSSSQPESPRSVARPGLVSSPSFHRAKISVLISLKFFTIIV